MLFDCASCLLCNKVLYIKIYDPLIVLINTKQFTRIILTFYLQLFFISKMCGQVACSTNWSPQQNEQRDRQVAGYLEMEIK